MHRFAWFTGHCSRIRRPGRRIGRQAFFRRLRSGIGRVGAINIDIGTRFGHRRWLRLEHDFTDLLGHGQFERVRMSRGHRFRVIVPLAVTGVVATEEHHCQQQAQEKAGLDQATLIE